MRDMFGDEIDFDIMRSTHNAVNTRGVDISRKGGNVRSGKTAYSDDTNSGFYIGRDPNDLGAPKINIGDGTNYLKWTGTSLNVKGDITVTNTTDFAPTNADNTNSALTTGTTITGGGITLSGTGVVKTIGKDNVWDTTSGVFLGWDSSLSAYGFSVGGSTGYVAWDGVGLVVKGLQLSTSNGGSEISIRGGQIFTDNLTTSSITTANIELVEANTAYYWNGSSWVLVSRTGVAAKDATWHYNSDKTRLKSYKMYLNSPATAPRNPSLSDFIYDGNYNRTYTWNGTGWTLNTSLLWIDDSTRYPNYLKNNIGTTGLLIETTAGSYGLLSYGTGAPGVLGSSDNSHGVVGNTNTGTYGLYTGDAAYIAGGVTPFTGSHSILLKDDTIPVGTIIVDTADYIEHIDVNNAILSGTVSTTANSTSVIGILSRIQNRFDLDELNIDVTTTKFINYVGSDAVYVVHVNSVGEGLIRVCSENGDISIGDYIVSSTTIGVGMRQLDDLLHNYTVAKSREAVNWDYIVADTNGYKECLIACTYHCG